jgi:nicotinate-nucleotide adenylyltransferase
MTSTKTRRRRAPPRSAARKADKPRQATPRQTKPRQTEPQQAKLRQTRRRLDKDEKSPPRAAAGRASREAAPVAPAYRSPPHAPGQRIGLFGGTFDPPHEAHLAASRLALKRLALDRVWWLVTPGNPLKNTDGLAPLAERMAAARALARDSRIDITGFEATLGVRYTYDTIRHVVTHCRGVHFVWIMGADNLRSFHRWQRWRDIAALVPIAVVDRLGPSLYAVGSVAAHTLGRERIRESAATSLPTRSPPAWVLLHGLKSPLSSTALRARRRRKGVVKLRES